MRRSGLTVLIVCALLVPFGCARAKANKETFCRELRRTPNVAEALAGLQSEDSSAIGEKARQAANQFSKLERSAPRDIRSDVSQVADLVSKIAKAVERSPGDPFQIARNLRSETFDSAGSFAAALRVIQYSRHQCHFEIGQPTGRTPATSTPGAIVPMTPTT